MVMCKVSKGANSDPSVRFVRIVCNTPEPMAVLAFDWTLADLERFCTNPQQHVILGVDPTSNLGSFHVTVTTYQHPSTGTTGKDSTLLCSVLCFYISGSHLRRETSSFLRWLA